MWCWFVSDDSKSQCFTVTSKKSMRMSCTLQYRVKLSHYQQYRERRDYHYYLQHPLEVGWESRLRTPYIFRPSARLWRLIMALLTASKTCKWYQRWNWWRERWNAILGRKALVDCSVEWWSHDFMKVSRLRCEVLRSSHCCHAIPRKRTLRQEQRDSFEVRSLSMKVVANSENSIA